MDGNLTDPPIMEGSPDHEHLRATLDLPDIIIPAPLHNPLPLQCLAADALPKQVKEEIDRITAHYGAADAGESEAAETKDKQMVSKFRNRKRRPTGQKYIMWYFRCFVTEFRNERRREKCSCSQAAFHEWYNKQYIVFKILFFSSCCRIHCCCFAPGYGLRIVGGVKCQGGELHAQVVCVNPQSVPEQLVSLTTGEKVVIINSAYNNNKL